MANASKNFAEAREEFAALLDRARSGDEQAAQELYDRFGQHVLRAIRRPLNRSLRPKFDSVDFAQMVWESFFLHVLPESQFDGPQHMMSFLESMARHKTLDANRRFLERPSHDVHRERPLEDGASAQAREEMTASGVPREQLEEWIKGQPEIICRVVRLMGDGLSLKEIADMVGVHEVALRRKLRKLCEASE